MTRGRHVIDMMAQLGQCYPLRAIRGHFATSWAHFRWGSANSAIIQPSCVFYSNEALATDVPRREPQGCAVPDSHRPKHARFLEHLKPLQGALESYCRRSVFRSAEVEDVLQSALMKAFRDFDRYAEGTCFRAWIFKYVTLEILAGNRCIARQTNEELAIEPVSHPTNILRFEELHPCQLADAPEVVLEQCDDALAAAVWELRPLERSSLLLHAIGEFKYREIAEILELPIGTVMSHLSRARKRLRERLGDWSHAHNVAGQRETGSA
jgi:RNA polymerase sigma-70 factor (ECF subfamily)